MITLPCFKGSIIQHWKASEVNKAQNEYLKERLPGLDPNITLGEIRDLKSKILEIGTVQDLELSSIASAFVFFEKLLVKVRIFDSDFYEILNRILSILQIERLFRVFL